MSVDQYYYEYKQDDEGNVLGGQDEFSAGEILIFIMLVSIFLSEIGEIDGKARLPLFIITFFFNDKFHLLFYFHKLWLINRKYNVKEIEHVRSAQRFLC